MTPADRIEAARVDTVERLSAARTLVPQAAARLCALHCTVAEIVCPDGLSLCIVAAIMDCRTYQADDACYFTLIMDICASKRNPGRPSTKHSVTFGV
jgi:hypothetical protein